MSNEGIETKSYGLALSTKRHGAVIVEFFNKSSRLYQSIIVDHVFLNGIECAIQSADVVRNLKPNERAQIAVNLFLPDSLVYEFANTSENLNADVRVVCSANQSITGAEYALLPDF